jgi:hypothetical protein
MGNRSKPAGLVGAVLVVSASLLVVRLDRASSMPPVPPAILPAPRPCPMGIQRFKDVPIFRAVSLMKGHVSHWLPSGFGVAGA